MTLRHWLVGLLWAILALFLVVWITQGTRAGYPDPAEGLGTGSPETSVTWQQTPIQSTIPARQTAVDSVCVVRVTDARGGPLVEAGLYLHTEGRCRYAPSVEADSYSDEEGRIEISLLEESKGTVAKPGFLPVTVAPLLPGKAYDVVLKAGLLVSVQARDESGAPVPGTIVCVSTAPFSSTAKYNFGKGAAPTEASWGVKHPICSGVTDSNGRAELSVAPGPLFPQVYHEERIPVRIDAPSSAPGHIIVVLAQPWVALLDMDQDLGMVEAFCRFPHTLTRGGPSQSAQVEFADYLRALHPKADMVAVGLPSEAVYPLSGPPSGDLRMYCKYGWHNIPVPFRPYEGPRTPLHKVSVAEIGSPPPLPMVEFRLIAPDGTRWHERKVTPFSLIAEGAGFSHRIPMKNNARMPLAPGKYSIVGLDKVAMTALETKQIQVPPGIKEIDVYLKKWLAPIKLHVLDSEGTYYPRLAVTHMTLGGSRQTRYCTAGSLTGAPIWCVSPKTMITVRVTSDSATSETASVTVSNAEAADVFLQL